MSIKAIREQVNTLMEEKDGIFNSAVAEVRALTPEEVAKRANIEEEVRGLEETLALAEEFRFDDSNKLDENLDNALDETLHNEMRDYIKRGYIGTELRTAEINKESENTVLVPSKIANEIIQVMTENSKAFEEATKIPSVSGKLSIIADDEENDMAEIISAEGTEANQFSKLKFSARKLDQLRVVACYVVTQQLLNNAGIDIVKFCMGKLARKHAKLFEKQIFQGTGKDKGLGESTDDFTQFRGLTVAAAYQDAKNIKSGIVEVKAITTDAIKMDDIVNIYNNLHPDFLPNAKFYMTRGAYDKIAKLKSTDGQYYVQNGKVNGALTHTLLGHEIVISEKINDSHPIFFGDLSKAYCIMIKKGFEFKHIFGDTIQATQGTHLLMLDIYADGTILNGQAIVRFNKTKATA